MKMQVSLRTAKRYRSEWRKILKLKPTDPIMISHIREITEMKLKGDKWGQ